MQAARQGIEVVDLLPRELWSVASTLERVLDLTDATVVSASGVASDELVRPDHAFTQQIGEAAHERGVQAIKAPSATGVDQILAIFLENVGTTTLQVERIELWSSADDLRP